MRKDNNNRPSPPRWADRLLEWFCASHLLEEVLGDLHERYALRARRWGPQKARWYYYAEVLSYLRPSVLKRKTSDYPSPALLHPNMLRNYLKIAFRNLAKNRIYSFVNVAGLGIGLACCLAIGLYVWDEYRYDRFHRHGAHIYRVVEQQNQAGTFYNIASTPGPLAPAMRADFPEVLETCRIGRYWRNNVLQHRETAVEPDNVLMVDPSFFSLFDFRLVRGNPRKVFLHPDEVVITERTAERFFGADWRHSDQLLGQPFKLGNNRVMTLAGVAQNPPTQSHIQFDVLLSFRQEELTSQFNWGNNNYYTYIRLEPKADAAALNQQLFHYADRYKPASQMPITLSLQSLHAIYLHSHFDFHTDWRTTSSVIYLRVFTAVGLIVLVIALFNFMNLSTARATQRAREVGVRKAIGARRRQLMVQFLSESLLMTLLSIGLALLLLQTCLPLLNDLSGKSLSIPLREPVFGASIIVFALLVGLLAGVYPAFYLSAFQPVKVLKGVFDVRSGQLFRRVLVVSQFTMSVILVIGAIVIYQQLTYVQEKDLGFDRSQLLYVRLKNELREKAGLMKADLQQQSHLAGVTASSSNLIDMANSTYDIRWEGQRADDSFVTMQMNVDPDFLTTTGMQLVAGRNFDVRITADTASAYLINETAARRMNWTAEEALGKLITFWGREGRVIGVVKDFHFRPLTATIEPFLFRYWPPSDYMYLLVKTKPHQTRQALASIERFYKKYDRLTAPQYEFVDQALENQYRTQQRTGRLILIFSVLAIVVSCLGLFGLATYVAEQRTKEIGIRKVLGATVAHIVALLSKDFLRLVLLSIVIASPVAWYAMNHWLSDFAYRIELAWWIFGLTGLLAIALALLTVSVQSIRAALANPVKSLRTE